MKVELTRSRYGEDMEYVYNNCGEIVGFGELYMVVQQNLFRVYYSTITYDDEVREMLEGGRIQEVADWDEPSNIFYYGGKNYKGAIATAIYKKAGSMFYDNGQSLLAIGCSVKVSKQGQQLILDI